jgi:hypothetical protein
MIKFIKDYLFLFRNYTKQKKLNYHILEAKRHSILELSHWCKCDDQSDYVFQVKDSNIYVRLGRHMNEQN